MRQAIKHCLRWLAFLLLCFSSLFLVFIININETLELNDKTKTLSKSMHIKLWNLGTINEFYIPNEISLVTSHPHSCMYDERSFRRRHQPTQMAKQHAVFLYNYSAVFLLVKWNNFNTLIEIHIFQRFAQTE